MHQRARGGDEDAAGVTLGAKTTRFIRLINFFRAAHSNDADVSPDEECLDAEFGLTALHRPHGGSKTHKELRRLHAGHFGGDEMPELVQCDHEQKNENHQRRPPRREHAKSDQPSERESNAAES